LNFPLTWESDLKGWIKGWEKPSYGEHLELAGMGPRQLVPKYAAGNILIWTPAPKTN